MFLLNQPLYDIIALHTAIAYACGSTTSSIPIYFVIMYVLSPILGSKATVPYY